MPGLMMQHITTKEPDEDQIEVAIASLRAVLEDEGIIEKQETAPVQPEIHITVNVGEQTQSPAPIVKIQQNPAENIANEEIEAGTKKDNQEQSINEMSNKIEQPIDKAANE